MAALIFLEDGVSSLLQEQASKLMQENGPGSYLESIFDTGVGVDTASALVPGMRTATGSFNTGTTQTNLTITGLTFKPKAIIFWGTANTASNSADLVDANIAFGFTDGTSSQVIAMASLGGGTTGKGWDREATVAYIQIDTVSATIKCSLSLVSMNSDGFTLSQGVVPAASYYVNYLAIGGDDVTNAKVGSFSYTAATGSKAITGVGFQPDALVVIGNTVSNTTDNNTMFMLGAAVSATDQAVLMYHSGDSNNPTIVEHHTRYGQLIAQSSVFGGASFNEAAKLSSFDTDGFTLNVTTNTNHPPYFYLALKGGKYGMGNFAPRNTVGTITQTGLGFKPVGLLVASTNSAQTTTDTGMDSGGGVTIGAAGSATSEQSIWIGDANGVTPAVSNSFAQQGYLYRNYSPNATTPTNNGAISLNSFDSDGFSLSQDIAENSASNFAWFLAMGSTPVVGSGTTYNESPFDTGVSADSALAVETMSVSSTDTGVAVDAGTGIQSMVSSVSDTGIGVDSSSSPVIRVSTVADTATTVDTSSAGSTMANSLSDTATTVDASSASESMAVSGTDTATGVDSSSTTQAMVNGVSDTGTGIDSSTTTATRVNSISDTATGVDTGSATETQVETLTDTGVGTDSLVFSRTLTLAISDTGTGSDSLVAGLSVSYSLTDTGVGSDSVTGVRSMVSSVSDSGTSSDSGAGSLTLSEPISDLATTSDSILTGNSYSQAISDTATTADTSTSLISSLLSVTDTATGSDLLAATQVLNYGPTDTAVSSDSLSQQMVQANAVSDTTIGTDTTVFTRILDYSISDLSTAVDTSSTTATFVSTLADAATGTDSLAIQRVTSASISDVATTSDNTSLANFYTYFPVDTVVSSDSTTNQAVLGTTVLDTVAGVDTGSSTQSMNFPVLDSVQALDLALVATDYRTSVTDTITSSDLGLGGFAVSETLVETLVGTDSASAKVSIQASASSTSTVSDTVLASMVFSAPVQDQSLGLDSVLAGTSYSYSVNDNGFTLDVVSTAFSQAPIGYSENLTTGFTALATAHASVLMSAPVGRPQSSSRPLLVKHLELPLPHSLTSINGIHQSDVIIRSAIIAAIADMRANPWLLDYVFASLPRDTLTMADYGEREVANAKRWFMSTDIPVVMNTRIGEVKLPAISISLKESVEAETTLADAHYEVHQDLQETGEPLAGPFTPAGYNAATGIMFLDGLTAQNLVVAPGMIVVDAVGKAHDIIDVQDRRTFNIKPGTVADFSGATIRGSRQAVRVELESVNYKETYSIGCHAQGESVFTTYLHSIMSFILLRYKEALLEARGFERSSFQSSDQMLNEQFENEVTFSRWITITGFVRQYWPKGFNARITSATPAMTVTGAPNLPADTDPEDSLWIGEEDMLTLKR